MTNTFDTTIAGEPVRLLAERAIFWPAGEALLLADTHWGKAASFRAAGIPVPEALTVADLARLDGALARTGARRLVVLGDLVHASASFAPAVLEAVGAWRARNAALAVTVVRGNHDARAGDPPPAWDFSCVDEPYSLGPFALCHHPDTAAPAGYVLAGHLHPAVALAGRGRQRERLPCFLVGPRRAILPAFGGFTGAATVHPRLDERVFVVAGDSVVPIQG